MTEFLMIYVLMILGSLLIFFFKGVWEVKVKPDNFQAVHFFRENINRLIWLAFGIVIVGAILFLDPGGLTTILASLPDGLTVASPLVMGAALSGLIFMVPRNKSAPPAAQ